ncbi:MAG: Hsp20/alpha crystallin family protein, partial [Dehalococcoidia bacterium]
VVRATIPGFKAEDVDLTVTGDRLVLKGEVKGEKETKEERYLIRESRSASFHRSLALPKGLKTEKAEAAYEDGVLTVTIPKTEEVKAETHKIKVKAIEGQKS